MKDGFDEWWVYYLYLSFNMTHIEGIFPPRFKQLVQTLMLIGLYMMQWLANTIWTKQTLNRFSSICQQQQQQHLERRWFNQQHVLNFSNFSIFKMYRMKRKCSAVLSAQSCVAIVSFTDRMVSVWFIFFQLVLLTYWTDSSSLWLIKVFYIKQVITQEGSYHADTAL